MPNESLRASARQLLEEIEAKQMESQSSQLRLRRMIAEFRQNGMPVPRDLLACQALIEEEVAEAMFDNVPV